MTDDPTDVFDEISEYDSKALFKPKVVSLVVSNGEERGPNLMTASWWMLAGYNPFRYLLAVSHKTLTYELIEESQEFDLKTVPGQDVDVPLLADATGNIEMSVMDSFEFMNCTYYFGEVENAYVTEGGMDGRLLSPDADVLAYMGSDWGEEETKTKHRYYADITPESIKRFPGDEVVDSLPPELQEQFDD